MGGSCFEPEVRKELTDLTRTFTHDLMNGDGEENLDYLGENFAYVASTPSQVFFDHRGYVEVARAINEDDIRIVLMDQAYVALPIEPDYCCVLSTFRVFLSKGSGAAMLRGTPARLSFHWKLADGEPKLLVLESSYANDLSEAGASSVDAGEALDLRVSAEQQDNRLLEFRDDRRVSHFVIPEGVLYVEARGHKCTVHCTDDNFDVNEGIGAVEEKFGPGFVRLHRSYVVNPWHLRTLSEKGATMDNGDVLPVPARRLSEVREMLRLAREPKGDIAGMGKLLWGGRA